MTLSLDPTFRTVRVAWTNTGAAGDEVVQLFARPLGGAWSVVATYSVILGDQVASWGAALPVTFYDVALRMLRGQTPTLGYDSGNPDLWTALTAPLSKSTVNTTSAPVSWNPAAFVNAAAPINLSWATAQLNVPFLLEKSVNAGVTWTTVVAGLVALNYAYVIPAPEVGGTTQFRLTAQRGAVIGPTAGVLSVPMFITVGATTITSGVFNSGTRTVALVWSAATNATTYLLEKNPGSGWVTLGTISATTYSYAVPDAEINTTVNFRVTGQNGAVNGPTSAAFPVAMTIVIGAPVMSTTSAWDPYNGTAGVQWTTPTGGVTSYHIEASRDGGATWFVFYIYSGNSTLYGATLADINVAMQFRVIAFNGVVSGPPSNVVTVVFTFSSPIAPTGVTATRPASTNILTVTWGASGGNLWGYQVLAHDSRTAPGVPSSQIGQTGAGVTTFTRSDGMAFIDYVLVQVLVFGGNYVFATSATVAVVVT